MGRYDDIIDLAHPVSKKHPQMDRQTRAAQFSPFAALTGYDATIAETQRLTERKPELDENEKALLDERLRLLFEKDESERYATITFFVKDELKEGGSYVEKKGKVAKINVYDKIVVMEDKTNIRIDDIIYIDF